MVFQLTPSAAPPRREYVLLISGTMNPPHCGHIRLGLHAAQALAAAGHTVASICFVPVHDNYLLNKLALTAQQKAVLLSSLILVDYMFFELDNGMIGCSGTKLKFTCCLCYCMGALRPCSVRLNTKLPLEAIFKPIFSSSA